MTRRGCFRVVRKWLASVLLLVLPFSLGGCVWLAVPGLAYSGYKYEQKHNSKYEQKHNSPQVSSQSTHNSRSSRRRVRRRSTQKADARKIVDEEMWRG